MPTASPRSAGVLMHVTSLPSKYGIGDLGPAAHAWIDLLARSKQTWWQILPLNSPDSTNSPYSAHSAFAGNIYLISPESLVADGLLRTDELPPLTHDGPVQFQRVKRARRALLMTAFDRFRARGGGRGLRRKFEAFAEAEATWLDDFALFMALKEERPGVAWIDWPKELKLRKPAALRAARSSLGREIDHQRFAQFLFWRQLDGVRAHAHERGIKILGDVPIYVSMDSSDVWANPQYFQLDRNRFPKAVAGVPPDLFSKTGQRWGNPLYDWNAMRRDGFAWWTARLKASLRQADMIRIDHFRGLAAYWSVPASAPTAEKGKWVKPPGAEMLEAVCKALGELPLVAEDLGLITPDVIALRDRFGMAGMQILQFAFVGGDNVALPHNHVRNSIVYPGNHDNDTTAGWWKTLPRDQRERVRGYAPTIASDPAFEMIRLALSSVADRAIVTTQDVLGLASMCRMNSPGCTSMSHWGWRMTETQMRSNAFDHLAELTQTYFRAPGQNGKL